MRRRQANMVPNRRHASTAARRHQPDAFSLLWLNGNSRLPRTADTPLISPLPFAMPDLRFPLATGIPWQKSQNQFGK